MPCRPPRQLTRPVAPTAVASSLGRVDEDPVDRLYGLPAADFVAERDALAKALRAAGDREGAAQVKALAKPSRAAGALNRLLREHPDAAQALREAAGALAAAQDELLAGGAPAALRETADAARAAVDALIAELPPASPRPRARRSAPRCMPRPSTPTPATRSSPPA